MYKLFCFFDSLILVLKVGLVFLTALLVAPFFAFHFQFITIEFYFLLLTPRSEASRAIGGQPSKCMSRTWLLAIIVLLQST